MPLQDLTPQLRTRLNRMERSVGWFILLATVLLIFGFGYYIYNTAQERGWFKAKARFFTYAENGNGLHIGDNVELMGFDVGRIIQITPMPPKWGEQNSNNVYIEFEVLEPNFGYIWTEGSHVEFNSSNPLLGKREINLTKGTSGYATYLTQQFRDDLTIAAAKELPDLAKWRLGAEFWDGTNLVVKAWQALTPELLQKVGPLLGTNLLPMIEPANKGRKITAVWNNFAHRYDRFTGTNFYGLERYEQIALTDRLATMVAQIQAALPGVLQLTNQIAQVLSNATQLTSNLTILTADARPAVSNLAIITTRLTNSGSLGDWLIPTNLNQKLDLTLDNANGAITNLNTNLLSLDRTLDNVANITSNLNNQVQANTNIVTHLSDIIVHTDQFIQGLKRFWLFRHLFATKPVKPAKTSKSNTTNSTYLAPPTVSPKQKSDSP